MTNFKSDFLNDSRPSAASSTSAPTPPASTRWPPRAGLSPMSASTARRRRCMSAICISIMMLHWLQQTGGKPIALMGGGTTRVGDPSGKDETRAILTLEEIEANKHGIQQVFAKFLDFGDGQERRHHGRQRRWLTQLNYIDFLRDVGRHFSVNRMLTMDSVQAAARARAGAVVPRIQLHDPAGLRLRRAGPPLRLHAADGRLRPVGQHRQRHRSRPPHGHAAALRADHAAAHHRVGRQDGQDRGRRGVAQRRACCRAYDYWQFWRNTEDADVGALPEAVHDAAAGRDRAAGRARRAPRSTRRRRCWRPRRPPCCTAARRPRPAAETARTDLRGRRARREGLPTVEIARGELAGGPRRADGVRARGPRRLERRSAPADPGRRPAGQRRGR